MRIAQILNNKAHYIFETDSIPNYPPDPEGNAIVLIDITGNLEVQEGWDYDGEIFSEPIPTPILELPNAEKRNNAYKGMRYKDIEQTIPLIPWGNTLDGKAMTVDEAAETIKIYQLEDEFTPPEQDKAPILGALWISAKEYIRGLYP